MGFDSLRPNLQLAMRLCIMLYVLSISISISHGVMFMFMGTPSTQHTAHALRFPLDSDACLSVYLRNLQLHRRGVMGGVYTAPTLLILLYLSGIERAILLSFLNNTLYSSVLSRAISQASKLDEPRCIQYSIVYTRI